MKIIRCAWADVKEDDEAKERLKEELADNFGLYVEHDNDLLEITLNNEVEDLTVPHLLGVFNYGIAGPGVFIPYANISCIKLITTRDSA